MKYIPIIISMIVLLIGGFLVADIGSKVIESRNLVIKTRLIEIAK